MIFLTQELNLYLLYWQTRFFTLEPPVNLLNLLKLATHMCVCVQSLSQVQLFATPRTISHQAPLSMGFSRQEWSVLPFPTPGDLPKQGNETASLAGKFFTTVPPGKPSYPHTLCINSFYLYFGNTKMEIRISL